MFINIYNKYLELEKKPFDAHAYVKLLNIAIEKEDFFTQSSIIPKYRMSKENLLRDFIEDKFLELAHSKDDMVRVEALDFAAENPKDKFCNAVINNIEHDNDLVRMSAILAYVEIQKDNAEELLLDKIDKNNNEIDRVTALLGLLFLGNYQYFEKFVKHLRSEDVRIRIFVSKNFIGFVRDYNKNNIKEFIEYVQRNEKSKNVKENLKSALEKLSKM